MFRASAGSCCSLCSAAWSAAVISTDDLVPEQLWPAIQPLLPTRELGCGSPVTCWRRLCDWQRAGVWQGLNHLLLERLSRQGRLDCSRASLDSVYVRAKRGAA